MAKNSTLVAAINEYFGKKPGQTAGEFMVEIRALTPDDRAWFAREFERVGYSIVASDGSGRV